MDIGVAVVAAAAQVDVEDIAPDFVPGMIALASFAAAAAALVVEKEDAHVEAVVAVVYAVVGGYVVIVVVLNDVVAVLAAVLPLDHIAVVDYVVIYGIHEMPSSLFPLQSSYRVLSNTPHRNVVSKIYVPSQQYHLKFLMLSHSFAPDLQLYRTVLNEL